MGCLGPKGRPLEYHGGGKETIYLEITNKELSKLFSVSIKTINRWRHLGKLDPTNILDIINKFNNPHLLDNRRKTSFPLGEK